MSSDTTVHLQPKTEGARAPLDERAPANTVWDRFDYKWLGFSVGATVAAILSALLLYCRSYHVPPHIWFRLKPVLLLLHFLLAFMFVWMALRQFIPPAKGKSKAMTLLSAAGVSLSAVFALDILLLWPDWLYGAYKAYPNYKWTIAPKDLRYYRVLAEYGPIFRAWTAALVLATFYARPLFRATGDTARKLLSYLPPRLQCPRLMCVLRLSYVPLVFYVIGAYSCWGNHMMYNIWTQYFLIPEVKPSIQFQIPTVAEAGLTEGAPVIAFTAYLVGPILGVDAYLSSIDEKAVFYGKDGTVVDSVWSSQGYRVVGPDDYVVWRLALSQIGLLAEALPMQSIDNSFTLSYGLGGSGMEVVIHPKKYLKARHALNSPLKFTMAPKPIGRGDMLLLK